MAENSIALKALPSDRAHTRTWTPDAEGRARIASSLGLIDVRKLRADLTLTPQGKRGWQLDVAWGATVVQPCVVSLAPVATRIDRQDTLRYTDQMPVIEESEAEMPDDDTLEPLPDIIDITGVVTEMVALALPAYPRAQDATLKTSIFAEPGIAPMTDEDAKPFAGLAALREKLGKDGEET